MWKNLLSQLPKTRHFSSSNAPEFPTLYSFLQPSVFVAKRNPITLTETPKKSKTLTLTPDEVESLETNLHKSLITSDTDEAWKSFKTLTSSSNLPSKSLTNSLISHLSSINDGLNLKRAFASAVYVVEKSSELMEFETIQALLENFKRANAPGPAFALIKCMLKNRFYVPFGVWGGAVAEISRKSGSFEAFLVVFDQLCEIALGEKLIFMKPDLAACNAALEGCCRYLESVEKAEKVSKAMSVLGVRPDESSFGHLAYLFAVKNLKDKIKEIECLMKVFRISSKELFRRSMISGFVKSGNLVSVSSTVLDCLRESGGEYLKLGEETYREIVLGFVEKGDLKALATLIIEAQNLEPSATGQVDKSVGYGIISAFIYLEMSDKAHNILDEMTSQKASLGLGVYLPILKAYCKENRSIEATQLVMDIRIAGFHLDSVTYDSLIESSMSAQDFYSALSLFRDMREDRDSNLNASYLTMMTGFMENNRPELMASFLDEVVEDPRVELGTHDWNSIIHGFCKAGRLEEARRTFRRMIFLQYKPNAQTYLSLISGFVSAENYFSVMMLWNDVKRNLSIDGERGIKFETALVDAFILGLIKGGFFTAVMEVVDKSQEMKIFVDKWRYKHAFVECNKKVKSGKNRKVDRKKWESVKAFKEWVGLNT